MADEPDKPPLKTIPVKDVPHAPIIYFDGAPNFGCNGGVVNVTLAAGRHLSDGQGVAFDVVAVASLRCSIDAARDLARALNDAILLGTKTEGKVN